MSIDRTPPMRRGRPRGLKTLSREIVLRTALEIAEEEPDGEVSLREIARRLKVTPMAIYNHVESKNDVERYLLVRLFERHFEPVNYDDRTSGPELVRRCVLSLFGLAQQHPKIFDIFIDNALAVEVLKYQEALYDGFSRCGVPVGKQRRWARIFGSFIRGSVSWSFHQDETAWQRMEAAYQQVDPALYPHMSQAMTAPPEVSPITFQTGLDMLIAAMLRAIED